MKAEFCLFIFQVNLMIIGSLKQLILHCKNHQQNHITKTQPQINKRYRFLSSMKIYLVSYTSFFLPWWWSFLSSLSLCVTMVTRCQSVWHLHPHLQLSARSERCNHRDGGRGELCVSRFRWRCSLLLSPAQRLLRQVQMEDVYSVSPRIQTSNTGGEREMEKKEGEMEGMGWGKEI